jgi:hypothetical protein
MESTIWESLRSINKLISFKILNPLNPKRDMDVIKSLLIYSKYKQFLLVHL